MPWLEYDDFSGGLWDRQNDFDVPANALLELQNAFPLTNGGLRAGPVWTIDTTATNLPTGRVIGFFVGPVDTVQADTLDRLFIAVAVGNDVQILTRRSDETTWTLKKTHTGSASGSLLGPIRFATWRTLGDLLIMWNLNVGADRGAWRFRYNGGLTPSQFGASTMIGLSFITNFQDRALALKDTVPPGAVQYTPPASSDFGDINLNRVLIDAAGGFAGTFIHSTFPSDLVYVKPRRGIFTLQGSMLSPLIREIDKTNVVDIATWPAGTPNGLYFITENGGVMLFDGKALQILPQFLGTPAGMLQAGQQFSFGISPSVESVPFKGQSTFSDGRSYYPGGYIHDIEQDAWFKTTLPIPVGPEYSFWGVGARSVWAVSDGSPSLVPQLIRTSRNRRTQAHSTTWSATTAPFSVPHKRLEIREIELRVNSYKASSSLAITILPNDGPPLTKTTTNIGTGPQVLRVPIPSIVADTAKIRFAADGDDNEAPTLKDFRVRYEETADYKVST